MLYSKHVRIGADNDCRIINVKKNSIENVTDDFVTGIDIVLEVRAQAIQILL